MGTQPETTPRVPLSLDDVKRGQALAQELMAKRALEDKLVEQDGQLCINTKPRGAQRYVNRKPRK
jgi:hypothetical protein